MKCKNCEHKIGYDKNGVLVHIKEVDREIKQLGNIKENYLETQCCYIKGCLCSNPELLKGEQE